MYKSSKVQVSPDIYSHILDKEEQRRTYMREYHRLYEARMREYRKTYRSEPRNKQRKSLKDKISRVRREYDISLEEYDKILSEGCNVCGSLERLHLDHNHKTKQIRGCLCGKCNQALGLLQDEPNNIGRLLKYLLRKDDRYAG